MSIDWRPFVELVGRHQRFLLTTHIRPDGDALGSEKALAAALRQRGKEVRIVNVEQLPERYEFIDPEREIQAFVPPGDKLRDVEALIVVDTGTWSQLGAMADFIRSLRTEKAVIDHHLTQDDLGAYRFVDTGAEAAGRLVYDAIKALGISLTPEIAGHLLVALGTDTGWFHHGNVIPATFMLAAELTHAGAKPAALYQQIYERYSLRRLHLMGRVLSRLALISDGRVAYSSVLQSDYPAIGAQPEDSEDMVNQTVGLAGTQVSVLFTELLSGKVKISLRSRHGVDVAKLAEQFGGGGHRQAAGATLPGPIEQVQIRVLQAIEKALHEGGTP